MSKRLYNYKISCVGLGEEGYEARLIFFVYGIENVEAAREVVRNDNYRRKIMKQSNIDWRTVELRAVSCSKKGKVPNKDLLAELMIMSLENEHLDDLRKTARMHKYEFLNRS